MDIFSNIYPAKIIPDGKTIEVNALSPRVLLIEDDPSTRWLVRTALKENCVLATAPGVKEGIERIVSYDPHVVFLDINLPDGSGFTVLEWLVREKPSTIVVMFSGNGNPENMQRAISSGAYGFVTKPFSKEELLDYLHT